MNKVILMGRLTRDPELRYTATNNTAVASFSLAVNRKFSKTGEADFINIVAWDKIADFCSKYFVKGQLVSVVGRIQARSYDDAEGKKKYVTEVIAEDVYFAESKKDTEQKAGQVNDKPSDDGGFYPVDDGEDDLPF